MHATNSDGVGSRSGCGKLGRQLRPWAAVISARPVAAHPTLEGVPLVHRSHRHQGGLIGRSHFGSLRAAIAGVAILLQQSEPVGDETVLTGAGAAV